jgi:hypothetical protein
MIKKKRQRAPAGAVPEPAKKVVEEIQEDEEQEVVEEEMVAEEYGEEAEEGEDGTPAREEGPPQINDVDGLMSRYEDIVLGSGRSLPWLERLEIITPDRITMASVNDDLAREAALYVSLAIFTNHRFYSNRGPFSVAIDKYIME